MKKEEPEFSFRLLDVYKRLWGHPTLFFLVLLGYALTAAVAFFVPLGEVIRAPFEAPILRERIRSLEETVAEKDAVISRLGQGRSRTALFRILSFDETWQSDEARININRLLEYAEFAISKEDFRHAERLYEEAAQIQETISVHYYQGRLTYLQGDLKRTVDSWITAANLDTDHKYPILRLYVGIALYEMGEEARANRFIKEYVEGL